MHPATHPSQNPRRLVIAVFILFLAIRIVAMFTVPYTDTTEARYAEIARKMAETGDWITPQFDYGVPFWGKPPLHTWLAALGMKMFGANEFGGRILIFASACALLALLHHWVKSERGSRSAWLGTTLIASCGVFNIAMAAVMTDMVMLAGTSLSMVGFWNAIQGRHRARLWSYLFFVGLAIGMLAKGPVAVVLTAMPLFGWMVWQCRWRDLWERFPWFGGVLLLLALSAPWYVAAELKTPGFLRYFIVGEHFERFVTSGWQGDLYGSGHAQPRGMIWMFWALAMLPWTPFLLAPLFRRRRLVSAFRGAQGAWPAYLLCWAVAPMIFFTLATNIIPTYVITGVPASALLGLEWWRVSGTIGRVSMQRAYSGTLLANLVIVIVALVAIGDGGGSITKRSDKQIVAAVRGLGANYHTFGKRSYSAEFYTQGAARSLPGTRDFHKLATNGVTDAVVIQKRKLHRIPKELLARFEKRYENDTKVVLIEKKESNERFADAR